MANITLVRIPNHCWLSIFPSYVTLRCHLLETFQTASLRHSSEVLRYHPRTAACGLYSPLLMPRTQLNCAANRCFLATNWRRPTLNIWWWNAFFLQEPRAPCLSMIITFHFTTLVHALRPLDLVMMQQFFTDLHDYSHLMLEWCIMIKLSDNSRDLTDC
jgi:hypothetical protein